MQSAYFIYLHYNITRYLQPCSLIVNVSEIGKCDVGYTRRA